MFRHNSRRSKLAVAELWVLVQVAANFHKFRLQRCSNGSNIRMGHFEISGKKFAADRNRRKIFC